VQVHPWDVGLEQKLDLLMRADAAMRNAGGLSVTEASMEFVERHQVFISSEGGDIEQRFMVSGAGITATAVSEGELQRRSYPCPFGGTFLCAGYEHVLALDLEGHAPRVAEEALALLSADQCATGEMDLILSGMQVGLMVHESCGHPAELDRVFGSEANYGGTSFLTPDQLNRLQYGSSLVRMVADAPMRIGPGPGGFGYDDDGVPAQTFDVVRDGLFVGYLTSRETAPLIGETNSRGTARAAGWRHVPLVRIPNIHLLPGDGSLDDLVADTQRGLYLDAVRSWSIDDRRRNFQFGTELGWEIRRGRRVRMVKNPTYEGETVAFWNACDAICGPQEWVIWGVLGCGKGEPGQAASVGHGASPARFRGIRVGVGYAR
jgi:TldD protein